MTLDKHQHIFSLRKYMLTSENMSPFYQEKKIHTVHYKPKQIVQEEAFIPDKKDKLFWCFYVMLHGEMEYLSIENGHFKIEKDFKIDFVEKIRNHKDLLKTFKLKRNELENEFANESKITIKGQENIIKNNSSATIPEAGKLG